MIKKLLRQISSTTITTTTTSTSTVSTTTVLPNSIDNLQLWLKADAGVTMSDIPTTPISSPLGIPDCALWLDADKGITLSEPEVLPCNSPIDIPDCALWLDAEQGVTTVPIPEWTPDTQYLCGEYVTNNETYYRCNGPNDHISLSTFAMDSDVSNGQNQNWIPVINTKSLVSSWADQSGNERHCSQLIQQNRPAYSTNVINGKPALRFIGQQYPYGSFSSLIGDITNMNDIVGATIFLVMTNFILGDTQYYPSCIISFENETLEILNSYRILYAWGMLLKQNSVSFNLGSNNSSNTSPYADDVDEWEITRGYYQRGDVVINNGLFYHCLEEHLTLNNFNYELSFGYWGLCTGSLKEYASLSFFLDSIQSYWYDGSTRSAKIYFEGINQNEPTNIVGDLPGPMPSSLGTTTGYQVGGKYGIADDYSFRGDIAEIIIYSRALTNNERRSVELYLGSKYRIGTSSGKVDSWTDQSGHGRNFTQVINTNQPSLFSGSSSHFPNKTGAHSAVKFSVINHNFLTCSTGLDILQSVPGVTIAIIWRPVTYTASLVALYIGDSTDKERAILDYKVKGVGDPNRIKYAGIFGRVSDIDDVLYGLETEVYKIEGDSSSRFNRVSDNFMLSSQVGVLSYTEGRASMYFNGNLIDSKSIPLSIGNTSNTPSYILNVGSEKYFEHDSEDSHHFIVHSVKLDDRVFTVGASEISEIVVYPRALTELEINQLNYYFASKYPVGHGLISSWDDQSGNSRNATQYNKDYKPVLVRNIVNNKPAIYFSNRTQVLSGDGISGIDDLTECTLYIVCQINLDSFYGSNFRVFSSSSENINYEYIRGLYDDPNTIITANIGRRYIYDQNINHSHIISIVFDGSLVDYDRLKAYYCGLLIGLSNLGDYNIQDLIPHSLSDWRWYLIHDTDVAVNSGRSVYIYEVILYSTALSDRNRHKIEHYLGSKYNISIG